MREIVFYKTNSDESPIEDFLDSLNDKQAQKVVWVLKTVEELETVPTTYLKRLKKRLKQKFFLLRNERRNT